jgi:uncharacterized membrane protein YsdA (DUF1294 family)/cold shock CspA family protein
MKPRTEPDQALGRVSQWDLAKGLGFVAPDSGGERLLLRRADLIGRLSSRQPQLGEPVRYSVRVDGAQRRAVRVQSLQPTKPPAAPAPKSAPGGSTSTSRLLVIPAFALVLGSIHLSWPLPRWLSVLYGGLSMALFLVYGLDKWAARKGQSRVAERTLHALALAGGWPGALLGQQLFRHKTAKPNFLRWTWTMVCINMLLVLLICTPLATPLFEPLFK